MAPDRLEANHLDRSDVEAVHDPAQAWNALTVGAFTEKAAIADTAWDGWSPIAPTGDLSPWSTTSVTFQDAWPIKPEVILEGGNVARKRRKFRRRRSRSLFVVDLLPTRPAAVRIVMGNERCNGAGRAHGRHRQG